MIRCLRTFVSVGTGLIYAAIVAAWAAYLVPLWLRRHDEAAASRSVDKFSDAMRVLARRKTPAYATPADEAADQLPRRPVLGPPPRSSAPVRSSSVSAATRRRRVLVALVAALTVVTVLAVVALVPWWAVAIPSGVVVAFLFVSASAARAERAAVRSPVLEHGPLRRSARVTASYAHGSSVAQPGVDDEATVLVRRASTSEEPAAAEPAPAAAKRDDGLWDPVEVPAADVRDQGPGALHRANGRARLAGNVDLGPPARSRTAAASLDGRRRADRDDGPAPAATGGRARAPPSRRRLTPSAQPEPGCYSLRRFTHLGAVAQSGSAPRSHRGGQGFNSPQLHRRSEALSEQSERAFPLRYRSEVQQ